MLGPYQHHHVRIDTIVAFSPFLTLSVVTELYNYEKSLRVCRNASVQSNHSELTSPLEPPRTFSNHFSAEKARCVEVFDVSSEWFDCTEPSRTSSSQWEQGV